MGEDIVEQLNTEIVWQSSFSVPLLGPITIRESVVVSWLIMIIIMVVVLILTHKMEIIPSKAQAAAEYIVTFLENFFKGNTGEAGARYVPMLSTLFIYLIFANMIGMFGFGLKPPTKDINVTLTLAVIAIILVEVATFQSQGGLVGFLRSFAKPTPLMIPMNLMELVIRPTSLCFRLFGNVLGAFIIMELIKSITECILPLVFSLYFDVFDGIIQAYVFVFLTSIYIGEGMSPPKPRKQRKKKKKKKEEETIPAEVATA